MSFLLDTHVLIWSIIDRKKLSAKARKIIESADTAVYVSAISFWEISLKFSLGKLNFQGSSQDFPALAERTGFQRIPLLPEESSGYNQLKGTWHRDPFDRMLIWQAIKQDLTLISKDEVISNYKSDGLKIIW